MSENFNIENKNLRKEIEKEALELSEKERKEFKNEFDLINSLIEDHFKDSEISETKETTETFAKENDKLSMKQSFNDPAKLNKERLDRLGILKSDPTGKNLKASGEDI